MNADERQVEGERPQEPSDGESSGKSLEKPAAERLTSLDAYRGFIMLAMASGGFAFKKVFDQNPDLHDCRVMQTLAYQFSHVEWVGCSFWDLIQPSFMFMVGVAGAYSFSKRGGQTEGYARTLAHVLYRAFALVALGVFLSTRSDWAVTNYTFVNVLAQIGLGYVGLFLLWNRSWKIQLAAASALALGYWAAFGLYPPKPADYDFAQVGVTQEWKAEHEAGVPAAWRKNGSLASDFDLWFLNRFPRPVNPKTREVEPFTFNAGGYQTLNFIPSLATMILGLMAGEWLRSDRSGGRKWAGLVAAGGMCLAVGWGMSLLGCPLVKRIWTPSWAVYCAGWTFWMLAAFYGVIDVLGWKRWTFPLVVVGMNSIAVYVASQLTSGWIRRQLQVHVGGHWEWFFGPPSERFLNVWTPILQSVAVLAVLWTLCWWMYRRRLFLKI